jgi:tRNA pseudouridine38-40 synthase
MRIAVKFAYNGLDFHGYARQPGQRTIEQELLTLLCDNGIISDAKASCFRTASRTDTGVSALGNVCAFNTDLSKEKIFRTLTKQSLDILVYGIESVDPDFYPRHAKRRQYRYYLKRNALDVDAVLSAAALFTGEHNFQNFARVEPLKDPVRSIDTILVHETQDFLIFDFYAPTFLWNQIRRIMSALEKVGNGKLTSEKIQSALDHPEKKVDFQLAAPQPLLLKDVLYDFSFDCIKDYKKKLQVFEHHIVSLL